MTKDQLPPWAVKIIGTIAGVILVGFVSWLTYITTTQISLGQRQIELAVKLQHMEDLCSSSDKTRDIRYEDLSKKYDEMREDLRRFMERIEAKIDKINNKPGSAVNNS